MEMESEMSARALEREQYKSHPAVDTSATSDPEGETSTTAKVITCKNRLCPHFMLNIYDETEQSILYFSLPRNLGRCPLVHACLVVVPSLVG